MLYVAKHGHIQKLANKRSLEMWFLLPWQDMKDYISKRNAGIREKLDDFNLNVGDYIKIWKKSW